MVDLTLPRGVRTLTKTESDRLRSDDGNNLPSSPNDCPTCRGKKKFQWWDDPYSPEPETIVTYECPCVNQWVLYRFLLHAGIEKRYQRLSWADMRWCDTAALDKASAYIAEHESYVTNGLGIFMTGTQGTGKTGLATLILKALLGEGYDGYFTTFNDMITRFTAGWRDVDDQRWFHQRVKNAGVLVIDDPGKETKGRIELPQALIDEIIRHRVAGLRPTIIAANLSLDQFAQSYGQYVMSLLHEASTSITFDSPDARDNVRMRFHRERELGLTRPLVLR